MSLYIFDLGGTLVRTPRGRLGLPKALTHSHEIKPKPGVLEKLAALRASGHAIAIATNQSSVASGTITLRQAEKLVEDAARVVGGVDAWRLSPYSPKAKYKPSPKSRRSRYDRDHPSRKPHPGMLIELMQELGYAPPDTFIVGNRASDRKAAEAAGARYVPAKDFFRQG